MIRRLWRQNRSYYISIPPYIVEKLGLKPGEQLTVYYDSERNELVYKRDGGTRRVTLRVVARVGSRNYYSLVIPKNYVELLGDIVLVDVRDDEIVVKPYMVHRKIIERIN